ncbi:MAG: flotillin-like FloA family protein [Planctomycetes bacterium]|nr:flotillin-like FloA family protein [Planctomycetota bacterium]
MLFGQQTETIVLIVVALVPLLFFLCVAVVFASIFSVWLRALTSGVPLRILEILGMKFRKTDPRVIVRALVLATHAGVKVSPKEMESAYLQGVDLEKVTLAFVKATKEGIGTSFQELVEADLEGRLAEKLGLRPN